MRGTVHSESAPSLHPQEARRSLSHRDGFPGKGTDHQQDKEHQVTDTQRVRNDQEDDPADIGFTVGTALLAIAAKPNRHSNLNIFEPYNAIAFWTGTILSSSGSMRLFSASRSNAIWARSQ